MTDVPAGMVTDCDVWDEQYNGCSSNMSRIGADGQLIRWTDGETGWVEEDDHNAQQLLLRKQIWQLMGEVAEARDALNDPCGHSLHQWSMANGDCIRCGVRLELPKGWSYPK